MTNQSKPITNKKSKRGVRFGVSFAVLVLMVVSPVSAFAQGEPGGGGSGGDTGSGQSTPGVTVTAENPGTSPLGSDLRFTLTAHSEKSTVTNPSCRPQDLTLRCWGSLILRIPELGGMSVEGSFQVHRVAVGDISCGDDESGGCGGEGGGCGDENGDCGDTELAATSPLEQQLPLQAQVNGIAVVANPGTATVTTSEGVEPVTAGMQVQVMITLTDYGTAAYKDTAYVVVNQFVPGPTKPNIYTSPEEQVIQRVGIHVRGNGGS